MTEQQQTEEEIAAERNRKLDDMLRHYDMRLWLNIGVGFVLGVGLMVLLKVLVGG